MSVHIGPTNSSKAHVIPTSSLVTTRRLLALLPTWTSAGSRRLAYSIHRSILSGSTPWNGTLPSRRIFCTVGASDRRLDRDTPWAWRGVGGRCSGAVSSALRNRSHSLGSLASGPVVCVGTPSFHVTRAQRRLDLHAVQLDPCLSEHALEPVVELLEHGVVLLRPPIGLVDDEEDVGTVAVGADLDVAVAEVTCPAGSPRTASRSSGRRSCGRRCRSSRGSGRKSRPSSPVVR